MPSIYTAGPITGCSYEGCTDWRDWVKKQLPEIECYSPMRAKMFLAEEMEIQDHYDCNPLSTEDGIWSRDFFDCHRCDVLFVNLLDAEIVSIGTMFEMAWAARRQIPVVTVMEAEGNIHEHLFVRKATGFRVETLQSGVLAVKAILG